MKRSGFLLFVVLLTLPAGFFLFTVVLLFPGCGGVFPPTSVYEKNPLDDRTSSILSAATKVEVFRINGGIHDMPTTNVDPAAPKIGRFVILGRGKEQPPEFAARLNKLLTDPTTYTDKQVHCFQPGVAFRIWKGEEFVDFVICFACHNFYLAPSWGEPTKLATFYDSPNAKRLIRLAQDAFPNDRDLQALEKKEPTQRSE